MTWEEIDRPSFNDLQELARLCENATAWASKFEHANVTANNDAAIRQFRRIREASHALNLEIRAITKLMEPIS